jgi:excinuclease ABC subunit C
MGGKNMVGVMTVVEDGEPEKSEYKKFKIRTQENANDTGALKEVLERRFNHPEWTYPNLVVVDGALAQFNTATKVLKNLSLKIPIVGVVKDDKHKAKAFIGNEKIITENKAAILLANSEAHRFAINYHKNMRNKNFLS